MGSPIRPMLEINHVLMVVEQQVILHDRVLISIARRLESKTLVHITDDHRPTLQAPIAIQLAEVGVEFPIASTNVPAFSLVIEKTFALAYA